MRKVHLLGAAATAALLFSATPGMASDNGTLTHDNLQIAQSSGTGAGADAGASSSAGGSTAGSDGGASADAAGSTGAGTTGSTSGTDANSAADASAGASGGVTRPGTESTAAEADAGADVDASVGVTDTTDLGTSTSDSMSTETGSPESAEIDTATGTTATTGATTGATAGTMTEPAMITQSELTARYDEIVGMSVVNAEGDTVGDIEDIVIDPSDNSAHAVVGVGGFLGLGEKQVTIPVENLEIGQDEAMLASMGTSADLEARTAYEGGWKSLSE